MSVASVQLRHNTYELKSSYSKEGFGRIEQMRQMSQIFRIFSGEGAKTKFRPEIMTTVLDFSEQDSVLSFF